MHEVFSAFKRQYGFDARDSHFVAERFNNFRQRDGDTVVTYYTNFTQLVIEMRLSLDPSLVPAAAVQRSRFLSALKPAVKSLVMRTVMRHPDMTPDEVHIRFTIPIYLGHFTDNSADPPQKHLSHQDPCMHTWICVTTRCNAFLSEPSIIALVCRCLERTLHMQRLKY